MVLHFVALRVSMLQLLQYDYENGELCYKLNDVTGI